MHQQIRQRRSEQRSPSRPATKPSKKYCTASCHVVAPKATRTAVSRPLATDRANNTLATLAHVIRSSANAAPTREAIGDGYSGQSPAETDVVVITSGSDSVPRMLHLQLLQNTLQIRAGLRLAHARFRQRQTTQIVIRAVLELIMVRLQRHPHFALAI